MARRRRLAGVVLAMLSTPLVLAVPAEAEQRSYVALGDSYFAGTGAGSYLADGTSCFRSPFSYPSILAAVGGYRLDLRACAGAAVEDVRAAQLSALDGTTDRVTISVGGNDADFVGVLVACGLPAWASDCYSTVDAARTYVTDTLAMDLRRLYAEIRRRAPTAAVTVVGYPRLFNGEDCDPLTFFTPEEMAELNRASDFLNATTRRAAEEAGFAFARVAHRFRGHAVCDDDAWINGLTLLSFPDSFHPTGTGYSAGYAPVVGREVVGDEVAVTSGLRARAAASAPVQAALQRQRADTDRRVEARWFDAPDLDAPAVRAAAERAGVDVSSPASVAAADRLWDARLLRERAVRR
ncbi:MAG: SGNH/GDSL hydrolase family protein [Phycicoccus sp.]